MCLPSHHPYTKLLPPFEISLSSRISGELRTHLFWIFLEGLCGVRPFDPFLSLQSGLKRSGGTRFARRLNTSSGHHATWISKIAEISQSSCCGKALSLTGRFSILESPAHWNEALLTLALSGLEAPCHIKAEYSRSAPLCQA